MGKWIAKHKGLFIFLCIFLTIAVGIGTMVAVSKAALKKLSDGISVDETAQVERRNLVESISATGNIVSPESENLSAQVSGVKVTNVYFEIGDEVKAGDLICTLDSSDLQQSMDIAQLNQDATQASYDAQVASAQRQYSEAKENQTSAANSAASNLTEAERSMNLAAQNLSDATTAYNNAYNARVNVESLITLNSDISTLNQNIADKDAEIAEKQTALSEMAETDEGYDELNAELVALQTEKSALQSSLDSKNASKSSLKSTLDCDPTLSSYSSMGMNYDDNSSLTMIKNSLSQTESSCYTAYLSAQNQYASAKEAYDSAKNNVDKPSSTYADSVASAGEQLDIARTNAEIGTLSSQQQIESYQEQIDACNVYAPFDGIITSLNVEVGDTYAGGSIATVEEIDRFEVTTEIDEYDIARIKVGQKVVIKTNGTGDEEFSGTVKSIAPRATAGSSSVTYTVRITIDETSDAFKLDMTAKLSIIISSSENVITVPYEAVQTDDDGNKYVEVQTETDAQGLAVTKNVYVTVGIESDYYVEITSGDITEGMTVIVPKTIDATSIYDLLEEEGALEGF